MNYLRVAGYYQYGQLSSLSKTPEADNLAYVLSNKLQNQYNIGLNLSIPLGDDVNAKYVSYETDFTPVSKYYLYAQSIRELLYPGNEEIDIH